MQKKKPTTEAPRPLVDIECDFIPAIASLKAINDFAFVATASTDINLEGLQSETISSLFDRCLIESENVKALFYELADLCRQTEREAQS